MTKNFIYRFIRLKWQSEADMNEELNTRLHAHEEVVSMASDKAEVTVLVRCPVEKKK